MKSQALVALVAAVLAAVVSAGVPVYVMLPLDVVTNDNVLNDPGLLKAQLYQLKSGGVEGVMGDVWFGLVEQNAQSYNFTAYDQMLQIISGVGLKFQAVMSFHKCGGNVGDKCNIPLPPWVHAAASSNSIFYKDQDGHEDDEYISLWADNLPVFNGRTPIDVYQDFMQAFASKFAKYLQDGTITEIQVGMGPAGELRYPSYQLDRWQFCGVGAFQCYDDNALADLAKAAAAAGNPDWGHGGPNNAGDYNSRPSNTQFFSTGGYNNFQSDYGQFFLGWYSGALKDHGNRVLGAAASVFSAYSGVAIAGKISGIHWWYKDISHAAELTAGYFNTDNHNAYQEIAEDVFAKHGAVIDFTCLEMRDNEQPSDCDCGPYELVQQVKGAAHTAGIGFAGENALPRYDATAYGTIEAQASSLGFLINDFTYLRLSDTLLQSNNFGSFRNFVQQMANLSPSSE